jgi:RND family efflux transporter MFP subunit
MILCLIVPFAFAHGGEDHAAPPPSIASTDATTVSVAASSRQFEAVLRVKRGPVGSLVATTLLIDDFATSAPIVDADASAALSGPADVSLSFTPSTPGVYGGTATFPVEGDYAGALVLTTPRVADLLSLTGLHFGDAASTATTPGRARSVLGLMIAVAASLGVGYALGRRRGRLLAAVLLLVLAATDGRRILAHGGEDHGEAGPSSAPPSTGAIHLAMESQFLVGLRTAPLGRTSFQQQVPALGTFVARPGGSATLRSPVAGEIIAPSSGFLPPGSVVRAGDILGTVKALVGSSDRAALTEGRQQAANAVAEAKKAVALAERDAAQAANLGSGISDRERLEREQSVQVATAELSEAERAFAALGDGANVLVRAPVAGRIGSTLARPGDQVAAGDPLFRIVDAEGLWVEARVPEHLAAGLVTGGPASVVATAFPGETLRGTILDAGQEADPATGSFTITVAVDSADKDLHPGMSATAWVARGPPIEALVVPDDAVVDSNGMALGFVKVGPEQFELRELELGARSGESWEVLEGLEAGERVVVEGTYPLRSLAGR